jgi:NAD-dependent deacetylase
MRCHKYYDVDTIDVCHVPYCECGGIIKPDVVLYEEPLNEDVVMGAIEAISKADLMIIVGTSLVVYPAASYVRYFRGKTLCLINIDKTSYDNIAQLVYNEDVIKVISALEGDK